MVKQYVPLNRIPANPIVTGGLLNSVGDPIATSFNHHTHDPNDYGYGIPQWAPSHPQYGTYGPGSSYWNNAVLSAAIPADSNRVALAPNQSITAAWGIAAELGEIRGLMNLVLGLPATTNWGSTTLPTSLSLAQLNPTTQQSGTINISGAITASQIISSAPAGVTPFVVSSAALSPNLNADMIDGFHATSTAGSGAASKILALNSNGLYPAVAVDVDLTEAATNDALASGISTHVNNDNRIRFQLASLSTAAGRSGVWTDQAPSLVTSISTGGAAGVGGGITLTAGTGMTISQNGTQFTFASTGGSGASTGMQYPDWFLDAVANGLGLTTSTSSLSATLQTGKAYISGSPYSLTTAAALTLPASTTTSVWWNGTTVTVATTSPGAGYMKLWTVTTTATGVSNATDNRNLSLTSSSALGVSLPSGAKGNAFTLSVGGSTLLSLDTTGAWVAPSASAASLILRAYAAAGTGNLLTAYDPFGNMAAQIDVNGNLQAQRIQTNTEAIHTQYGTLSVGMGWSGASQNFQGDTVGTLMALNQISAGQTMNAIDAQTNGSRIFRVDGYGNTSFFGGLTHTGASCTLVGTTHLKVAASAGASSITVTDDPIVAGFVVGDSWTVNRGGSTAETVVIHAIDRDNKIVSFNAGLTYSHSANEYAFQATSSGTTVNVSASAGAVGCTNARGIVTLTVSGTGVGAGGPLATVTFATTNGLSPFTGPPVVVLGSEGGTAVLTTISAIESNDGTAFTIYWNGTTTLAAGTYYVKYLVMG